MAVNVASQTSLRRTATFSLSPSLRPVAVEFSNRQSPAMVRKPFSSSKIHLLARDSVARKVNCVEFPPSHGKIKKNRKYQQRCHGREGSIARAFSCTVFVVLELRSYALRLRGLVSKEDVEAMAEKVQIEMNSSFAWLFREVFSRTPDLMLDLMILVVDFVAHSMETKKDLRSEESAIDEEKLWALMVEEASRMHGPFPRILRLIHSSTQLFVSPVSVEIEADDYEEYDRRDLIYQRAIYEEPKNPLWFFNYGQFLCLVRRDFDRAEECFLRAIELDPNDAEVLSQYATFLWMVRQDPWAAEERYQQAIAAEPTNTYCVSRYASFLWGTDGEGYLKEYIDN